MKLLVPVDGSEASNAALDFVAARVKVANAFPDPEVRLLNVQWPIPPRAARAAGLGVNAGHDLSLDNLTPFLTGVGEVDEVSIGHALISDALERGYTETVRAYLACIPGRA